MVAFAACFRISVSTTLVCRARLCFQRPTLCAQQASGGKIYIVGSGPSGVDHLTFRAARLISSADILVVDALADPSLLDLRQANARVIHVGKRGGDASSVPQSAITGLLVQVARENPGCNIVRLKSGDPCVFGRSSEEITAIQNENLPFEIVPGVSSVTAAAAACGLSLTDKTLSKSVVMVSGHDPDALDYEILARMDTIVVLMAGKNLHVLMRKFITVGNVETSRNVFLVKWALRQDQEIVTGSVADIALKAQSYMPDGISPSVVILSKARTPGILSDLDTANREKHGLPAIGDE